MGIMNMMQILDRDDRQLRGMYPMGHLYRGNNGDFFPNQYHGPGAPPQEFAGPAQVFPAQYHNNPQVPPQGFAYVPQQQRQGQQPQGQYAPAQQRPNHLQ